jgi:DNA-binding transcriptional regulator GbsR (MarR family)
MKRLDDLEIAYTMDLLARLTESIETYLDDDRWDGIKEMHKEIKEANKLTKAYYKRLRELSEWEAKELAKEEWVRSINKDIREGVA